MWSPETHTEPFEVKNLSMYEQVYVPMHVCAHVFVSAPVCLCVETRSLRGYSPGAKHLVSEVVVSHGPSKTTDYPVSPKDLPVPASSVLGLRIRATMSCFVCECWGSNSGPCALVANTEATELSYQLLGLKPLRWREVRPETHLG